MIRQTEALAEMIRKAVVIFLLMAVPFLTLEAVGESPTSLATDEESSHLQATPPAALAERSPIPVGTYFIFSNFQLFWAQVIVTLIVNC